MSRHDRLQPLPNVEMEPLRQLVAYVHILERIESGEYLPGVELGPCIGGDDSPFILSRFSSRMTNLHLAVKRLLHEARAGMTESFEP